MTASWDLVTGGSPVTTECEAAAGAAAVWEEGTDEDGTASSNAGDEVYDIMSSGYAELCESKAGEVAFLYYLPRVDSWEELVRSLV
jgi:hypothetical protein